MKGPFFNERDILYFLVSYEYQVPSAEYVQKLPGTRDSVLSTKSTAFTAAPDNKLICTTVDTRLLTHGRLTPRGLRSGHTDR